VQLGRFTLPFLGGVYLRYLPLGMVQMLLHALPEKTCAWTYLHPYDIDAAEGFTRFPDDTPLWANMLLMRNRKGVLDKLARLMRNKSAGTLRSRLTPTTSL
jgi:hypothetical protein